MYVLQLNPKHPDAWRFCVCWPGYWSGMGYVDSPKKAIRFRNKREAAMAAAGIFAGLNGCMKIVKRSH